VTLANKITIARILLIPFFIGCLVYYDPTREALRFIALGVFCVAILTDAVDGFLARFFNQRTKLGIVLDPIADKLLLSSAIITMALSKNLPASMQIPAWIAIIIISRDIIIVIGSVLLYLIKQHIKVRPSVFGKITTATQMSAIVITLLQFPYGFFVWLAAAVATVISGLEYIYKGSAFLGENEGYNHGKHAEGILW